mmetsp:Transcript_9333/g.13736  ORF Transcript_9333/g.13736 Transcript_9333/m.13736 type:complete len:88 (+) Transcript_9333:1721-1984(+)
MAMVHVASIMGTSTMGTIRMVRDKVKASAISQMETCTWVTGKMIQSMASEDIIITMVTVLRVCLETGSEMAEENINSLMEKSRFIDM